LSKLTTNCIGANKKKHLMKIHKWSVTIKVPLIWHTTVKIFRRTHSFIKVLS